VPTLERVTVYGSPDADQLDALGPVFLAFFGYFFVFILTGVSFLRERIGGTLERLLATPVTRGEIVTGYSLGFGLFAGLQVAVLLAFALADIDVPALGPIPAFSIGLGIESAGSPVLVFVVALLLALGAVNLAILLSTFARTELQVLQFIPLVIVPQGLLGGLIWSVDALPDPLEAVSRVLPLRYGIEAMRGVLVRGAGLDDPTLQQDLVILAGIAIAFVLLASRTIRREVV
jgi:ABC-2 type transport system permease protein